MKLRDKETGEIWTLINRNEGTSAVIWVTNGSQTLVIESIEELTSRFEDYEEPKDFWYIDVECGVMCDSTDTDLQDKRYPIEFMKSIGNYFETEEEAKKAVEKLKAWKRLKDNGFEFGDWFESCVGDDMGTIVFHYKADEWNKADLDLLFGGEK